MINLLPASKASNERTIRLCWVLVFVSGVFSADRWLFAQAPEKSTVVVELYLRPDSKQSQDAEKFLKAMAENRKGISVRVIDVTKDKQGLERLSQLTKRFGRGEAKLPTIYMTDRLWVGFGPTTGQSLEDGLTIHAYVRPACPHCQAAKVFLNQLAQRWPALSVNYHDVAADRAALQKANDLAREFQVRAVSFPVIHAAGRLRVGFLSPETTGKSLEAPFRTPAAEVLEKSASIDRTMWMPSWLANANVLAGRWSSAIFIVLQADAALPVEATDDPQPPAAEPRAPPPGNQGSLPIPGAAPLPDEAPIPDEAGNSNQALLPQATDDSGASASENSKVINVEILGKRRSFDVEEYGLPAFTIIIGLVDGFNPCAMWVLIFLLSILVNIRDRTKILAIAGVFVLVSGLAYFAFMAAWLSVFNFVGMMRPVQIALGTLALFVGIVNVKDFFAYHKGISLSIPKSAHPKLYRRMQDIVKANYLGAAIAGAVVLAVIVNVIELLCTAGLPALYTQILTMHQLSTGANYAYLGLYIVAYMADDMMMIGIALVTLSNRRMQETEGRWLKLVSGVVILLLGGVMIFRPDWLMLA